LSDRPVPTVSVSIKIVKNLGNFESIHMEAGCTAPIKFDESYDDAFERVYDLVERNLSKKIDEAVKEIEKIGL
jgi:hypothetical protein